MRMARFILLYLFLTGFWAAAAVLLAFEGVWMSPVVNTGDTAAFQQWVNETLEEKAVSGSTAVVLLEDGKAGFQSYRPAETVNGETLFPTASFSKFITALAVLSLHEANQIDLDAPVSEYLTQWQLPESSYDHNGVTVRRLLSHTAGLTDGLGFADYAADESLPSTVEALTAPRASEGTRAIVVGLEPGSEYAYSGGGYLLLQLLVEEVTGEAFAKYVERSLLQPLGMNRSNYEFYGTQNNAAVPFHLDGTPADAYQYASPAATGFNSTANDLSRLAQALLSANSGVISSEQIAQLQQPNARVLGADIWGAGSILYAPLGDGQFVFGHDGSNEPAINSSLRVNPATGDGIIGLASGHPNIASSIAGEWVLWQTGKPDVLSVDRAFQSALVPMGVGMVCLLILVVLLARRRPAK